MESLGFVYTPGANVADFLTGVTVPTERCIQDGVHEFPRNADEIRHRYAVTTIHSSMAREYSYPNSEEARSLTADFQSERERDKHRSVLKESSLMVGFCSQVNAAIIRQYQLVQGDCTAFLVTQASTVRATTLVRTMQDI